MNIALFDATKYWSGGAERVYLCAKGFKEKDNNVTLICLATSRLNRLLKNKVNIYNIHPVSDIFDVFAIFKIFYILLKHKIEVLDIHSPKFYWFGVFLGKILNKKVFITRNVEYRKKGLKKKINNLLYNFCDGIITTSDKVKNYVVKDFNLKEDKVVVIYDDIFFPKNNFEDLRNKYNISDDTIVLSIIGRIEENKRQDFAIEITKELKNKGYNVKLFVIGPVEEKNFYIKILNKVKNYSLSENVVFTGFVENVCDYIFSSDIVLCCSLYESMGKVVLESLYLKTPVVSTSAVKVEEVLKHSYISLLYTTKKLKLDEFLKPIEEIIKNIKKIRDDKKNNLKFFNNSVSLKMVEEYLKFYQKM